MGEVRSGRAMALADLQCGLPKVYAGGDGPGGCALGRVRQDGVICWMVRGHDQAALMVAEDRVRLLVVALGEGLDHHVAARGLPIVIPGPVTGAFCWAHGRRKFFVLADIAANARRGPSAPPISPLALEAVRRIDRIFELEREINGRSASERLAFRREHVAPAIAELEAWMRWSARRC